MTDIGNSFEHFAAAQPGPSAVESAGASGANSSLAMQPLAATLPAPHRRVSATQPIRSSQMSHSSEDSSHSIPHSALAAPGSGAFSATTTKPVDSHSVPSHGPKYAHDFIPSGVALAAKPDVDPLLRDRNEIEKRRQRFDDRRHRILHAKTRLLGVDLNALNAQVSERSEREFAERERGSLFDEHRVHHAKLLTALEEEKRKDERKKSHQLNEYRKQQISERRAKELTEKSNIQQLADMQTSFLQFDGEDQEKKIRGRAQASQLQDWLSDQVDEQRSVEARQREDEHDYSKIQKEILELRRLNEESKEIQHKNELRQIAHYNQQLAATKKAELRRQKEFNQLADENEIAATLRSQLLNESMAMSHSSSFKGFSTEKRQAILNEQARQQEELRLKRLQKAEEEKDWNDQQNDVRRHVLLAEREKAKKAYANMERLKASWNKQAKQKTVKDQYEKHILHTNPITDDFFQQFGTSCR